MAYIEKRVSVTGKITYRARIRPRGCKEVSATFLTRTQAIKWAKKMEGEMQNNRYFGREDTKERTFEEFIGRYFDKELPKNPKAYKKQKLLLTWWNKHIGKFYLCHITPAMIAELRDKLMDEKTPRGNLRTPSTANRYIASLSRAFNICQREWHWIKENPVLKITRPKENKARERYLDKGEVTRLLEACKKSKSLHLYSVVLFAICTGARKGEILNLKWEDVDFKRSTATFRNTKNGETRVVYLSSNIIDCLQDETKKRLVMSPFVFPSMDGKQPADIKKAWENVIQQTELKDVCFHTLRHTTGSHLGMNDVSSLGIAAILGHKSLSMVKRYSHLSTSSTAKALERLDSEMFGDIVNVKQAT